MSLNISDPNKFLSNASKTYHLNVESMVKTFRSVFHNRKKAKCLFISSSEVYSLNDNSKPHHEDDSLNMNNDIGKVKQLFILGIDCTKFGPTARYIMLAASLFLFTCGYGYYQEWVVYSWFKRKLGLFTTMFYFIGTAICALVEKFITTYYEFPGNFTTNLRESKKFLQITVGVSTQYDEEVMVNVESHQLALRGIILGVMSEYSEQDVAGREGKQGLADSIKDALNIFLEDKEGFGGVEGIHFTSFVLQ